MYTKRFNSAKLNGDSFFSKFNVLRVHADEGEDPSASGSATGSDFNSVTSGGSSFNFEEMIARVRKEEKDKLYGRIQKAEEEVKKLRESNNGYIMQIAEYQKRLEEAEKKGDDSKVAELTAKVESLEKELEDAKANAPDTEAIRAEIEAEYKVKMYIKDKLAENKDNILSVFLDGIHGNTEDEVDASIASAVEKSTQIKKDLGLIDEEGNPVEKETKKSAKKKEKNPPVANPAKQEEETFDADYIRSLDPRSPEYAEFRKKMGLK